MENIFLTHSWEYEFKCVCGGEGVVFRSRGISEFSCFVVFVAWSAWHGSQLYVRRIH